MSNDKKKLTKSDKLYMKGWADCIYYMLEGWGVANTDHKEAYEAAFGNMTESEIIAVGIDANTIAVLKKAGLIKT